MPIKVFFALFAIILATFLAYQDSLYNDFLTAWDTESYVTKNLHIQSFSWENIQWMFTSFYMSNWHPLTWLSHALDYALFGSNPWGHHLTNLILHSLNSVLVFALFILFMQYPDKPINNKMLLAGFFSALLFGIHPQHVESVAWIAERKDVLCLFAILLSLIFYVLYTIAQRHFWYLSSLFCFGLALLSKPMAVTIPILIFIIDIYPLKRTTLIKDSNKVIPYKILLLEKLPFLGLSFVVILITLFAQKIGIASLDKIGLVMRLWNAANSTILYLSKFIFPVDFVPFYPHAAYNTIDDIYLAFTSVIAFFLITFLCIYLWYKNKYYWLSAWVFYLIALSPVVGIIQVGAQSAADRYAYLPTLPFYLLTGLGIAEITYNVRFHHFIRWSMIIITFLISVTFIYFTKQQTLIWKNDLILWHYTFLHFPNSPLVNINLGDAYYRKKDYKNALKYYQKVVLLVPEDKMIYLNIGQTYFDLNLFTDALNAYQIMLDNHIELEFIYYRVAHIYTILGDGEKAQSYLKKALTIKAMNEQKNQQFLPSEEKTP